MALIGPQVKAGYKSTTTYHHQSVLRTMLEALGTTANFPSAANTAPDMREFFKGNAGSTVLYTEPIEGNLEVRDLTFGYTTGGRAVIGLQ